MKQKILSTCIGLLFFIIFGYFYGSKYWDFQKIQDSKQIFQVQNTQDIASFSLESLPLIGETAELFMTPNLALLDRIESQINLAEKYVYVEVYIFTEKRIREALIGAHKRGVELKVLLENNPYQSPYINDDTFEILQQAGVDVRWSDPLLYSLNHTKLLMIDESAYISTGNFSSSLFKSNKDFLLYIEEKEIVSKLKELFTLDFQHELGGVFQENLVISPYNSREKLEYLFAAAEKNIDVYFPYLQDESFEKILLQKAGQGIEIKVIAEKEFYNKNIDLIEKYRKNGIQISPLKKSKLHAKMIMIDKTYMYIGSINFSTYSMDKNRELGIIIRDKSIISKMQNIFISDL